MRNLAGWLLVAFLRAIHPVRTERTYHESIAGAGSESLSGAQGTTGGSADEDAL